MNRLRKWWLMLWMSKRPCPVCGGKLTLVLYNGRPARRCACGLIYDYN